MKIGFDAKRAFNNSTGLGNYSRSIIQSLSENNKHHDIYLFTPTKNSSLFNPDLENIQIITPKKGINKQLWRFKTIKSDLKKLDIDIFHGLSNEIPLGIQTKTVVTIHDLLFLKYPHFYNFFDRRIYKYKSKMACQKADKIIAISKQTKDDIIKYYNINPEKIHVIYQSCHRDFINRKPEDEIEESIQKELKTPYFLYVGSIEKRKNLIFLLEALKQTKNMRVICVGYKTEYYKKVQNFIIKNNLKTKVSFLDIKKPNILSILYQKSRGLIYPSIDEGFGIPIIEAMYSQVPVIISDQNVFQEIGGKDAYYFKKNNIESLIQQMEKTWSKSTERNNRIQKNFEYVQKFNEKKQSNEIMNIYNTLLQ